MATSSAPQKRSRITPPNFTIFKGSYFDLDNKVINVELHPAMYGSSTCVARVRNVGEVYNDLDRLSAIPGVLPTILILPHNQEKKEYHISLPYSKNLRNWYENATAFELNGDKILNVIRGMFKALSSLHKGRICHGNLKMESFVLQKEEGNDVEIKIMDVTFKQTISSTSDITDKFYEDVLAMKNVLNHMVAMGRYMNAVRKELIKFIAKELGLSYHEKRLDGLASTPSLSNSVGAITYPLQCYSLAQIQTSGFEDEMNKYFRLNLLGVKWISRIRSLQQQVLNNVLNHEATHRWRAVKATIQEGFDADESDTKIKSLVQYRHDVDMGDWVEEYRFSGWLGRNIDGKFVWRPPGSLGDKIGDFQNTPSDFLKYRRNLGAHWKYKDNIQNNEREEYIKNTSKWLESAWPHYLDVVHRLAYQWGLDINQTVHLKVKI